MNKTELAGKSKKCRGGQFWTDFGAHSGPEGGLGKPHGGLGGPEGVLGGPEGGLGGPESGLGGPEVGLGEEAGRRRAAMKLPSVSD